MTLSVGRSDACHTRSRSRTMAASSTTMRAYLRPRPASGSSRLQHSMLPPPARSSRCCCSDFAAVTGCSMSRSVRQDCSRNLNVGANHAHASPSAAPRAVRSMPSVVLPIWRPHTATLKRLDSVIIVCCAGCSAGRFRELALLVVDREESGEKSKRGVAFDRNQLGKLGSGLFFKPRWASCCLWLSRKRVEVDIQDFKQALGDLF